MGRKKKKSLIQRHRARVKGINRAGVKLLKKGGKAVLGQIDRALGFKADIGTAKSRRTALRLSERGVMAASASRRRTRKERAEPKISRVTRKPRERSRLSLENDVLDLAPAKKKRRRQAKRTRQPGGAPGPSRPTKQKTPVRKKK